MSAPATGGTTPLPATAPGARPDGPLMLRVHALSFSYPRGPKVLDAIDLEVAPGEFVALLGPNGSGKSTLLSLLVGPEALGHHPWAGQLEIGGHDGRTLNTRARALQLSYVPQTVPVDLRLDVEGVVRLGRFPHRQPFGGDTADADRVVEEAMTACGVTPLRGRAYGTLSGGERQRVILAGCLAQQTPCLLLDEPTSALDLRHGLEALAVLATQARAGKAVLVATHDVNLAAQFCSRLVLLAEGRVVADGPPEQVLTREVLAQVYGVEVALIPVEGRRTPLVLPLHPIGP